MALKKVLDIIPPKEKSYPVKESVSEVKLEGEKPIVKAQLFSRKNFLILGLLIIFSLSVWAYFVLPKAEVEIWPEATLEQFEARITVDKAASSVDFEVNIIPGTVFEVEKTAAEVFPATGKLLKAEKAEGVLRVYNNYSTSDQILITQTRFVSTEGKLFRTPVRVVIPGGHYEKGKLVPGEADVKVVADRPGPEYNIEPSTFSIPGFAGTARYTKFYAKSFEAMKGGFSEEVSQVSKDDLAEAEAALGKKAAEQAELELISKLESEQVASEFHFLPEGLMTEVLEKFSLAKAGEEAAEFNSRARAKSEALVFKKEDLKEFVKNLVISQIPEDKKLYEKSLAINYSLESIDLKNGKLSLYLEISAKIYYDVDTASHDTWLRGKTLSQAQAFLNIQPGVERVKVELWPFWVKKVPNNQEKIKIRLQLD